MSTQTESFAYELLRRNGVIIERARRAGRSLSYEERMIILCGRSFAKSKNVSRHRMNVFELEGERDRNAVFEETKVEIVFAYYNDPYEDIPAFATYYVRESNHPILPKHGHVGVEEIQKAGMKIPMTPTYEAWVKAGRKVVRP